MGTSLEPNAPGTSASSEVTVVNTSPPSPILVLTPDPPKTTDTLNLEITQDEDPDGDNVTHTIQWTFDGVIQVDLAGQLTIGPDILKGTLVKAIVTPYDGVDYGTFSSSEVTVGNSPPPSPTIELTPDLPSVLDTITVDIIQGEDQDGDDITHTMTPLM